MKANRRKQRNLLKVQKSRNAAATESGFFLFFLKVFCYSFFAFFQILYQIATFPRSIGRECVCSYVYFRSANPFEGKGVVSSFEEEASVIIVENQRSEGVSSGFWALILLKWG